MPLSGACCVPMAFNVKPLSSSDLNFKKKYTYNVRMIEFEWDEAKAAANIKKHHVSFDEAKSIFFDEFGVQFFDDGHSSDEERFLMLGMSSGAKLLIVCHCERDHGATIRIISARKATKRESAFYRGVNT